MNVLVVTGRIIGGPVHSALPDGEWCEFRLDVDLMPWLEVIVRFTARTITSGGTPAIGCLVSVRATLRRDNWVVRDGTRATCWSVDASAVTVLDDESGRSESRARAL